MAGPFVHDGAAVRVLFGAGVLDRVAGEVRALGARRVLLIASASSAGHADRVAGALGPLRVARIRRVVMHVPAQVVDEATMAARTHAADLVVCLGGGSAIGLGKAVARTTGLPIVAVPTTYSGSEMTPIWGVTENRHKTTGRDPLVQPRVVLYDPELTVSLPANVSAASGMNALAHCLEALYAPGASPVTTLLAEEGIRALASALPQVVGDPDDLAARGDALYGAWLAGWVLGIAGMAVHHKICHVLGGAYDLPHAATHSAMLPYCAAFNADHDREAMVRAARALAAPDAAGGLWDLARAIGAPTSLKELGFPPEEAEAASALVCAGAPVNPRPVERAGIRDLLLAACVGDRPA